EKIDELKIFQPRRIVTEFTRSLLRELDFGREEKNLHQFRERFENHSWVDIPKPVSALCTSRVLTMEFVHGRKLSELDERLDPSVDLEEMTYRFVDLNLQMIFDEGFYHADPHPGNVLLQENGRLVLLDFGHVGRIGEGTREAIEEMLFSVFDNEPGQLSATIGRLCELPPQLDESALENDLSDFVGQYGSLPVSDFQISNVLNAMFEVIRIHQLRLPQEAITLLRVLVVLEGTARSLCPTFKIMEVLKPLHKKLFMRRLSPARQYRKFRRMAVQFEKLAESMPRKLSAVVDQIRTGKIDINLDHRRLGSSVNRLVYGILTSALFLGSSIMLAQKVPPLLFVQEAWMGWHQVSVLGLLGFVASFGLGVRLLWAIMNSGSLDRPE
ncbi:MAG: AarF/UbiB family protein, partial [Planctomycetota bacterium]|nr:AarF/UbiB family protein [Planctomycetota bacterium]